MLQFTLVKVVEYAAVQYFYAIPEKGHSVPLGVDSIFDEVVECFLCEVWPLDSSDSTLDPGELQVEVLGLLDFTLSADLLENSRWFITIKTAEHS